jgi:hypothetical protein
VYNENLQTARESLAAQKDELSSVNTERRASIKEVETYNTALDAEIGSNEQLRAQLKLLTAEYDGLSQEQRENTEEGEMLTQNIEGLTDKLKENESAVGDNRRNVGNYSKGVTEALGNVKLFGLSFNDLSEGLSSTAQNTKDLITGTVVSESVQKSQAAVTASQTLAQKGYNLALVAGYVALNIFKLALIATGLGAFLVVAGSLVAYFQSTEAGAQKLRVAMAVLGSVVDNVKDVFINIGAVMVEAFENPEQAIKDLGNAILENLLERGRSLIDYYKFIFTGQFKKAFKEVGDIVTGVGGAFDQAATAAKRFAIKTSNDAKDAAKLQREANQLIVDKRVLLLKSAQLEGEFARLRAEAADKDKLTQLEIIEILERSKKVKEQSLQIEVDIAAKELEILEQKAKLATTDEQGIQEIADKRIDLAQKEAAVIGGLLRIEKQIGSERLKLKEENLAAELRLIKVAGDDRVATQVLIQQKETAALLEQENIGELERKAIIAEGEQAITDLMFAAIEERLEDNEDALEVALLTSQLDYLKQLNALGDNEQAKQELTARFNKENLEATRESLETESQIIEEQIRQLMADSSANPSLADSVFSQEQLDELEKRLLEAGIALEELDLKTKAVGKDEDGNPTLENNLKLDPEQKEAIQATYGAAIGGINEILNAAGQNLKTNTDLRIATIDKQVESGVLSEESAEKKKEKIRKEAFQKQKKLNLASASVSYFTGLIQAVTSALPLPFPANVIAGGITSAALTATYAANVKQIKAQKFEQGGLVQGPSHSKGGVPFTVAGRGGFEAEGGEFMQKKKAVNHYGLPFMQALNNMQIPKMFAEGGFIPTPQASLSSQVSRGVSELAQSNQNNVLEVINVEQNFSKLQTKVNNIEQARTY